MHEALRKARHLFITPYKCRGRSNGGQRPPNFVPCHAGHAIGCLKTEQRRFRSVRDCGTLAV